MMNAKQETITFLSNVSQTWNTTIKCAKVAVETTSNQSDFKLLKIGFTQSEYDSWLQSIDINYEPSIGERLVGNIWFEDGSWAERYGECNTQDQPEWWGILKTPVIDNTLI